MRQPQRLVIAGSLAVFVVGCQPAPASAGLTDADKAAIRAVIDSALKIGNTQPLDAPAYVKTYYAPDAIVLPPNAKEVKGTAELEKFFASFPPISNLKFNLEEIEGGNGMAFLKGTYSFTMTPPGAASMEDAGKYLELWKKQADGSWRSERDIFNSDLPAAPAESAPPPPPPSKKK